MKKKTKPKKNQKVECVFPKNTSPEERKEIFRYIYNLIFDDDPNRNLKKPKDN